MRVECDYCNSPLVRVTSDGRVYGAGLGICCEECFVGEDNGPCWDDFPEPTEEQVEWLARRTLYFTCIMGKEGKFIEFTDTSTAEVAAWREDREAEGWTYKASRVQLKLMEKRNV